MKHIELQDWSEFDKSLRSELTALNHTRMVAVRLFRRTSFDFRNGFEIIREVNRLAIALGTGTDRDATSPFWNYTEPGNELDYDHSKYPTGKQPYDIIYAFLVDASRSPYVVHRFGKIEEDDLTAHFLEGEAILIYDSAKLERKAENEYWFKSDPREALLLVYSIKDEQ
jgi:hypothetical protein